LAIGDLFLGPYQVLVAAQGLATLDERLRALSGVVSSQTWKQH
jgi:hypothetical protein